jgi:hypothetical protein
MALMLSIMAVMLHEVRLARSVTHTTGTVPVCRLTAVRPGVPIATLTAAPPATNALPQDGERFPAASPLKQKEGHLFPEINI